MIYKIAWLWRQFKGKYIDAIKESLFAKIHSLFDTHLEYLNNFSIETANDSHLTLIGMLGKITRTVIEITAETYFWFTRLEQHNNEHGLSDLPPSTTGGQVIDINSPQYTNSRTLAPTELFRKLLLLAKDSKGAREPVSLVLLDDLLYYHAGSKYLISFVNVATEDLAPGDVEVFVNSDSWGDTGLLYRDTLSGTLNNIVSPVQKIGLYLEELQGNLDRLPAFAIPIVEDQEYQLFLIKSALFNLLGGLYQITDYTSIGDNHPINVAGNVLDETNMDSSIALLLAIIWLSRLPYRISVDDTPWVEPSSFFTDEISSIDGNLVLITTSNPILQLTYPRTGAGCFQTSTICETYTSTEENAMSEFAEWLNTHLYISSKENPEALEDSFYKIDTSSQLTSFNHIRSAFLRILLSGTEYAARGSLATARYLSHISVTESRTSSTPPQIIFGLPASPMVGLSPMRYTITIDGITAIIGSREEQIPDWSDLSTGETPPEAFLFKFTPSLEDAVATLIVQEYHSHTNHTIELSDVPVEYSSTEGWRPMLTGLANWLNEHVYIKEV